MISKPKELGILVHREAFQSLVDRAVEDSSEINLQPIVQAACDDSLTDEDVAFLATRMAESGHSLSFPTDRLSTDLASTGGPTSLSTILTPLYLVGFGAIVPKLGVPGRPAGGIDVFAQLDGYSISPNTDEVLQIVDRCGFAHFLAGESFAPMDAKLFRYRQKVGAQEIPELVIASLLAKKLAVGIRKAGLDVRVAPFGNFGKTWDESRKNADRFNSVAVKLELESECFLTDARYPYQPYVGRGEALLAVREIADETANAWLQKHSDLCRTMAATLTNVESEEKGIEAGDFAGVLRSHLEAQGSSWNTFENKTDEVAACHVGSVRAGSSGFLKVDIDRLRDVFVRENQPSENGHNPFPDRVGIILVPDLGSRVSKGDILATIRAPDERTSYLERELTGIITVNAQGEPANDVERVHG